MTTTDQSIRVIRSDDRHRWDNAWLTSLQSFPATGNFDLVGNAHGVLLVNNDDTVDAAEGFDTHEHTDVEIITWVVDGALHHRDSRGNSGILTPGVVQRMTAGSGITHSERNAATRTERTRLRVVQMWVATEYAGREPEYAEADVTSKLSSGELVPIVSGLDRDRHSGALSLPNPFAALHAARMTADTSVMLPGSRFGHLYVVRGSVAFDGTRLTDGDAARLTDAGDVSVTATEDAEILYWEMHTGF